MTEVLTKARIDDRIAKINKGERAILNDDREPGLCVRIGERGAKWVVQLRTRGGQKGWLPKQGVVLLAGQSRIGKTFLSLELAGALATCGSFFGRPVRERVGVLILAAEGGGTIGPRLEALRLHRLGGVDVAVLPIAWAEISDANEIGAIVSAAAVEMKERFGLRPGVVGVDTVAAAFNADENDAQLATAAMKALGKLAADADVLVIAVAHYGKSDGAGVRGSSAWTASADVILAATGDMRKRALRSCRRSRGPPLT